MASEKPEAHDPLETMEIPTEPPRVDPRTDEQRRGNLLPEYEQQFEQLKTKLCSSAGVKLSKEDNISSHLMQKDRAEWYIYAENRRCLVTIRELKQESEFVGIRKMAQS